MAENDGLTLTPILIVNLDTVACRDCIHCVLRSLMRAIGLLSNVIASLSMLDLAFCITVSPCGAWGGDGPAM